MLNSKLINKTRFRALKSVLTKAYALNECLRQNWRIAIHIMNIAEKKLIRKGFFVFISLLSIPLYWFSKMGIDTYHIMIPAVIFMQIYLCFMLRNMAVFLLLTIYSFVYFLYLIPYFYFDMQLSMRTQYQNKIFFLLVCLQFYVFYAAICLSAIIRPNPERKWLRNGLMLNTSSVMSLMMPLLTLLVVIYLFMTGGSNVLIESNSYGAYMENLHKSNSVGLLVVMLISFSYFVIKNSKWRNVSVFLFSGLIAYYAVTRGFRVIIAPVGFLVILLWGEQKISVKFVFVLAFLGLVGLTFVNALKMNESFSLMYVFSSNDSFILSHHADQLYGSAVATGLVEQGKISFFDRIFLQIGLFAQSVIPPSLFPLSMRFPHILTLHSEIGGGGLFMTGGTLLFGYIGMFLITYFLSKFIQFAYITSNKYIKILVFVILVYSANWFSYDLNVVLRFPILGLVVYYVMCKFRRIKIV